MNTGFGLTSSAVGMSEPVTITSNVVATGSPLGCSVDVISCAEAARIGQRTRSHVVNVVATLLWDVCIFQSRRLRRRTAPCLQRCMITCRLLTRLQPLDLMLEAGGRIRRRAG